MSAFNKIQRQYNWVCKHIKGPLYRIKMQELYNEANKAILDPKLTPEQKLKLIGIRDTLKTIQVVPTLMLNTKTGEKTLALIKKSHMDKMISEERLQMTKVTFQDKVL